MQLPSTALGQSEAPRLSVSVSPFIGRDSNVSLSTDADFGVDAESTTGGLSAAVSYQFVRRGNTTVAAELNAFHVQQFDVDGFDVTSVAPSLRLTHRWRAGDLPVGLSATTGVRLVDVADDGFNSATSVFVDASLSTELMARLQAGVSLRVSNNDFDGEGFFSDATSRDSVRYEPAIFVAYRLLPTLTRFSVSFAASINDADGLDQNYTSRTILVAVEQPVATRFGVFSASASAALGTREHDEFTSQPRREQDLLQTRVGLSWQISANVTVFGSVNWMDSDANRVDFSYDRTRSSFGLIWRF